jgi:RNA polymerase sigma-70 factor (ECF subfamily)
MLNVQATAPQNGIGTMNPESEFRKLLYTYQDRVYNQAYRMLGNQEDAEEATQDIFLNIYRSMDEFRGESKITTWIYRITSNVCISRLRKKQLDMTSLDEPRGDDDTRTLSDMLPEEGNDPESILESEETKELIRSEVRNLPPDWAMAISLFHFDDLSYEEIADVMGIPKATVATYIFRGRKQLAQNLLHIFQ